MIDLWRVFVHLGELVYIAVLIAIPIIAMKVKR